MKFPAKTASCRSIAVAAATFAGLLIASLAEAATLKTMVSFTGTNGADPRAGLIADAKGNLYGTAALQGAGGYGEVFRISPAGPMDVLYSFLGNPGGGYPASRLLRTTDGSLYGMSWLGGGGGTSISCNQGCGTAFKIATDGTTTLLHLFQGYPVDGARPTGALVSGPGGYLYGVTNEGGAGSSCVGGLNTGCGAIFRMKADGTETLLYSFTGGADGGNPNGGLIVGADGALYGATAHGGIVSCPAGSGGGCGTVFRFDPQTRTETVLYAFDSDAGVDGKTPVGNLLLGADGNFHGVTAYGGATGNGTVYSLSPGGVETVVHSFTNVPDGSQPADGLVAGADGNLYGLTSFGGATRGSNGTLYRITPQGQESVLYSFSSGRTGVSPYYPMGAPVQLPNGRFAGVTLYGGGNDLGTAWELSLP